MSNIRSLKINQPIPFKRGQGSLVFQVPFFQATHLAEFHQIEGFVADRQGFPRVSPKVTQVLEEKTRCHLGGC